jgi:tRNA A37 threonylcarbamoyladenosine synthetase subunit TsaC/SUA5/YrdC
MPNGDSFRVVKDTKHNLLLDRVGWVYSSSANLSGESYCKNYAKSVAEVIVHEPNSIDSVASKIYRVGVSRIKRLR